MTVEAVRSSLTLSVARQSTTTAERQNRPSLLARCGALLWRLNGARALGELDPRLARDIGVVPGCGNGCPEGFPCDPRPLWGIGLTPLPMDTVPPWSRDRCRS